jgi:signal transduction histidine kinase
VSFHILPPVWRRAWFLAAVGVAAAALAYSVFQYRLRMLLEVERVRTGIATDLHDDIGSSLSQISILSELARRKQEHGPGAAPLASIAELSREIVSSMSDIVWAVNPHRDSLHDLTRRMRAFAGETFGAMGVPLRFSAPSDEDPIPIPAELRRQVFLIFKEATTNAATHSGCRQASVDLALYGDWLTLVVEDDGRGMQPGGDPEGHGLRSMAERARAIGGTLDVRSEPGRGTTVRLRAPLRRGISRWKAYAST